jgi:hypothetical protein
MKKINLFKKITIVLLALVALVGTIYSTNTNSETADGETEYLKKGDGSYLTYRGSSEKVLTLKEYNNPIQQYRAVLPKKELKAVTVQAFSSPNFVESHKTNLMLSVFENELTEQHNIKT